MDTLPPELIHHLVSFLRHRDIVRLQLVSQRLLLITRDNNLWRNRCYERSPAEKTRQEHESIFPVSSLPAVGEARTSDRVVERQGPSQSSFHGVSNRRRRAIANWDRSYSQEKINWYQEYISRHGPISIGWLQQPVEAEGEGKVKREVLGMGLLKTSATRGWPNGHLVVAPLDDRSVCLWDVTTADHSLTGMGKGRAITRSRPGLLASGTNSTAQSLHRSDNNANSHGAGIVECVSVDSLRKRAYFAVDNWLSEVDLETLQIVAETRYPSAISALSDVQCPVPLTVGTNNSLHIHDGRLGILYDSSCPSEAKCEMSPQIPSVERLFSNGNKGSSKRYPEYAQLLASGPVSIVHLADPERSWDNTNIYVAGRFPSILNYDRRFFPRVQGTIHSGARLSSLTFLPHALLRSGQNNQGFTSNGEQQVQSSSQIRTPVNKTLIACGEYKGKGSLELYGLEGGPMDPSESNFGISQNKSYQNRQTASSSKLLSVVNHGTRLLFSDGDGTLKWMERDGSTEVRRWNINQGQIAEPGGLFAPASNASNGDVVRKILTNGEMSNARVHDDELLLWTGERIALLNFANKPDFADGQFGETVDSDDEALRLGEERLYGQSMRKALERQADEVRFVQGLGLGTDRL
ncbi:MAG: hypothetical protein M1812_003645 [Candelaria pacifica]|nr:MAG: hypothetical protein M1812_003645 [Candelaria pacifica]